VLSELDISNLDKRKGRFQKMVSGAALCL